MQGWISLPGTMTSADYAHLYVTKEIEYCDSIQNSSFSLLLANTN